MKRVLIATCVAATCTVALAAQTPPQTEPKKADQASRKDVTLQGCLQAGEQPNTFVIANVKIDPAPAEPSATGTSGMAANPEIAALKGSSLRLIGSPKGTDLKEHVGHTVEVTGALAPKDAKSPSAGAPTGTGAAAGTSGAAADMRKLNVKSVKHISPTCTAG